MSDADRKVTVAVETKGDPSGAKAVVQGVQEVKKAAESATKALEQEAQAQATLAQKEQERATKEAARAQQKQQRNQARQAQREADKAAKEQSNALKELNDAAAQQVTGSSTLSDKSKKLADELYKGGKAADSFRIGHEKVKMLVNNLVRDMPELGTVVSQLANPWLGLALAVGATVGKMMEFESQMREMELRPGPDWETDAQRIQDVRQAYEDGAVSAAAFAREIQTLARAQQTPQEKFQQQIEKLKEWANAEEELLGKQHERDVAAIGVAEDMGLLKHETALAARLKADEDYTQKRIELENRIQRAEITLREKEQANVQGNVHVASNDVGTKTKQSIAAHQAEAHNKDDLETRKAELQKALEEKAKIQDDLAELNRITQHGDSATVGIKLAKLFGANIQSPKEAEKLVEDRASVNDSTIANLRKAIKKHEAAAPGLQDASNKVDEELDILKTKLRAYATRLAELEVLLPSLKEKATMDTAFRNEGGRIESQTRAIKNVSEIINNPAMMKEAEAGANAMAHGQKATANQTSLVQTLVTVLGALNMNQQQALQVIALAHNNIAGHQKEIESLKKALLNQAGQIKNSRTLTSG